MKFGLIGFPLGHSFSKSYFTSRFEEDGLIGFRYDNYELQGIDEVTALLRSDMAGFNVTIPYKSAIIPYLNQLDRTAYEVQAVNTVVRTGASSWMGYNTDVTGFEKSLLDWIGDALPSGALVLGSGGASKAVCFVLRKLGLGVSVVSRNDSGDYTYAALNEDILASHALIINTTPLGMSPHTDGLPGIPYHFLSPAHYLYDLIYNPANTLFLTRGQQAGARTKNGLDMLRLQADHAWAIWKMYGKF